MIWLLFFLATLLIPNIAYPHSGRTDSNGCHNEKASNTRHCHQPKITSIKPSFDRDNWRWLDNDSDCQYTRAEILISRALEPIILNENNCTVYSGLWFDQYSGGFETLASELDIDHIVPIKWAYDNGAKNWTKLQKLAFANDPDNLLIVSDNLNQSKGKKSPAFWVPPNVDFHCGYLTKFINVTNKYQLKIPEDEAQLIINMKNNCLEY